MQTEYKAHREKLLFDQERSMLPATQVILEQMLEQEHIRNRIIQIRVEIALKYREIRLLEAHLNNPINYTDRKTFVRKCPNTDCRGFLSTQWKCNLCSYRTCKECLVCMVDDEHKCNPADVETAKLLAKDSKPCPNCGEIIFKIDGCDQIFCTQCHTAFNWRTGRRETGAIHNPHYFEWLRRTQQDPDQVAPQCGRELDHYFIRQLSRGLNSHRFFVDICREVIHIREVLVQRYATHPFADNQDLRLLYLRKRLTDVEFQVTLQKREKAREKKQEYYRLFAMLIQSMTDIMYRLAAERTSTMTQTEQGRLEQQYIDEIFYLVSYVNECLQNIANVFKSKRYMFDERLRFVDAQSQ
jgi:ribosomal protein S27AE